MNLVLIQCLNPLFTMPCFVLVEGFARQDFCTHWLIHMDTLKIAARRFLFLVSCVPVSNFSLGSFIGFRSDYQISNFLYYKPYIIKFICLGEKKMLKFVELPSKAKSLVLRNRKPDLKQLLEMPLSCLICLIFMIQFLFGMFVYLRLDILLF